jgi:hypothetical protein
MIGASWTSGHDSERHASTAATAAYPATTAPLTAEASLDDAGGGLGGARSEGGEPASWGVRGPDL